MKTPFLTVHSFNKSLLCSILFAFILFSSCSPMIYYLGDSFTPTNTIEVYYAASDVSQEYRTIGKVTHGKYIDHNTEDIKNAMIKKAKENGADAIIFTSAERQIQNFDADGRLSITADFIRYK